ncbi:MAG TPA: hypothetical protein VFW47_05445 [Phenylobacterium sp.]|nr:hypothetical protein [Phenylobacterium sp.]
MAANDDEAYPPATPAGHPNLWSVWAGDFALALFNSHEAAADFVKRYQDAQPPGRHADLAIHPPSADPAEPTASPDGPPGLSSPLGS